MEAPRRHKRIATLQAKILAGIADILMALTAASGAYQVVENSQANETATLIENRAEFWKVVAGEQAPNASNVQTKLAIELRDELGAKSVQVTKLPSGIEEFRAGANEFGGIEDRIGLNPFEAGALKCETCGSLSTEMMGKLLFIKQGKLDQVLSAEQAAVQTDRGLNLTPFDLSLPLWIGLTYVTATTAALVIAIRVDARRNGYKSNMLSWRYEGGSSSDPYRRISRRLSPLYVPIVLKLERRFDKSKDGEEVLTVINLSESRQKLLQALGIIRELPQSSQRDPKVIAQKELIQRLLGEIDEQVEDFATDYQPKDVGTGINARLAAVQTLSQEASDSIKGRQAAIDELNGARSQSEQRGQTATG